jgi:hypothetical protein
MPIGKAVEPVPITNTPPPKKGSNVNVRYSEFYVPSEKGSKEEETESKGGSNLTSIFTAAIEKTKTPIRKVTATLNPIA